MYQHQPAAAFLLAALLCLAPLRALAEQDLAALNLDEPLPEAIPVISIMPDSVPAKSAILISQQSGQVLYEKSPDEKRAPASVTKIMTILLVVEAMENGQFSLQDTVVASEHACSMGGSQIWLEPGEEMSVEDLFKAVVIASANDASVALAELVAGTEDAFVGLMNERAAELGMENTLFLNCTGLDQEGHLTTARDIATMSRELMRHPIVTDYSTIWMDQLRGGASELVNTNRLVRFYAGSTGLKTGTTSGAGSCLSATAIRDDLGLVAVVMGAATSDERFAAARGLLDYGFANYKILPAPSIDAQLTPVRVLRGREDTVNVRSIHPESFVVEKRSPNAIAQEILLVDDVQAPVVAGQTLGRVTVLIDGNKVAEYDLKAAVDVPKISWLDAFGKLGKEIVRLQHAPERRKYPG
jgi:D-alanyl-D-alanine carboxypeptidase